jgi:hypothetical protein
MNIWVMFFFNVDIAVLYPMLRKLLFFAILYTANIIPIVPDYGTQYKISLH